VASDDQISIELSRLGLNCPKAVIDKLRLYTEELARWNQSLNLTSLRGTELIRRLVAEPLWIGEQLQLSGNLLDIGSGNGSPAIPLSSARVLRSAHLVEVRQKRCAFLRHVVAKLKLTDVAIEESRVEEMPRLQVPIDWITIQAVRFSPSLARVLLAFAHATTRVVWITAGEHHPAANAERLLVPGSRTEAWVFSLDQFCPTAS